MLFIRGKGRRNLRRRRRGERHRVHPVEEPVKSSVPWLTAVNGNVRRREAGRGGGQVETENVVESVAGVADEGGGGGRHVEVEQLQEGVTLLDSCRSGLGVVQSVYLNGE